MAILRRFCCCCRLRTGVMMLAWFLLVFVMFELTVPTTLYANRTILFYPRDGYLIGFSVGLPFVIAAIVLKMVCILCLARGAWSGNRFLLLPWLIMEMIELILYGLLVLISGLCVMIFVGAVGLLIWIIGGPIVGFWIYIWLCVLSCFQELRDSGSCIEGNVLLDYPAYVRGFLGTYQPAGTPPSDV